MHPIASTAHPCQPTHANEPAGMRGAAPFGVAHGLSLLAQVRQHVAVEALELAHAWKAPPAVALGVAGVAQLARRAQAHGDLVDDLACASASAHVSPARSMTRASRVACTLHAGTADADTQSDPSQINSSHSKGCSRSCLHAGGHRLCERDMGRRRGPHQTCSRTRPRTPRQSRGTWRPGCGRGTAARCRSPGSGTRGCARRPCR